MSYSWIASAEVGVKSFAEAVRFIAAQDGGPARLLRVHCPDAKGLCVGCGMPGTGTAYQEGYSAGT